MSHHKRAPSWWVLLLLLDLLGDDVVAQPDALVADVDGRTGDELLHLLLRLAAEGAGDDGDRLDADVARTLAPFGDGGFAVGGK